MAVPTTSSAASPTVSTLQTRFDHIFKHFLDHNLFVIYRVLGLILGPFGQGRRRALPTEGSRWCERSPISPLFPPFAAI